MMKRVQYLLFLTIPLIILLPSQVKAATSSVTVAGSLQSELGCAGDWDPACATTHLSYDSSDDVWQNLFSIPAGNWEYKAALDDSWTINYGVNATLNGANISLGLASTAAVKFYYDDKTHWITDNENSIIAVAAGSFQSELGATGDWDPANLRSWLQDPDGDGIYSFSAILPAGNYETKVALYESWDENYGEGGVANGANILFSVPSSGLMTYFSYNSTNHVLSVETESTPIPEPSSILLLGSGLVGVIGYGRKRLKK
jgi:hypothetical protein